MEEDYEPVGEGEATTPVEGGSPLPVMNKPPPGIDGGAVE